IEEVGKTPKKFYSLPDLNIEWKEDSLEIPSATTESHESIYRSLRPIITEHQKWQPKFTEIDIRSDLIDKKNPTKSIKASNFEPPLKKLKIVDELPKFLTKSDTGSETTVDEIPERKFKEARKLTIERKKQHEVSREDAQKGKKLQFEKKINSKFSSSSGVSFPMENNPPRSKIIAPKSIFKGWSKDYIQPIDQANKSLQQFFRKNFNIKKDHGSLTVREAQDLNISEMFEKLVVQYATEALFASEFLNGLEKRGSNLNVPSGGGHVSSPGESISAALYFCVIVSKALNNDKHASSPIKKMDNYSTMEKVLGELFLKNVNIANYDLKDSIDCIVNDMYSYQRLLGGVSYQIENPMREDNRIREKMKKIERKYAGLERHLSIKAGREFVKQQEDSDRVKEIFRQFSNYREGVETVQESMRKQKFFLMMFSGEVELPTIKKSQLILLMAIYRSLTTKIWDYLSQAESNHANLEAAKPEESWNFLIEFFENLLRAKSNKDETRSFMSNYDLKTGQKRSRLIKILIQLDNGEYIRAKTIYEELKKVYETVNDQLSHPSLIQNLNQ
ncbi:hypothetical protein BY996DRAFT_7072148, partial [Phakopsora pachyrhizi]